MQRPLATPAPSLPSCSAVAEAHVAASWTRFERTSPAIAARVSIAFVDALRTRGLVRIEDAAVAPAEM